MNSRLTFDRARAALVVLALAATASLLLGVRPAIAQDSRPQGVRTLYLIRHGQHEDDGVSDPFLGSGLSALGAEQARLVASRLKSLGVAFDTLFVSPMTRAVDTARPIADSLAMRPVVVRDLAECTTPTWREDIMATLEPGEADSCLLHMNAVWSRVFRPSPDRDCREILVCHGNVIRYLVCRALGVDTKAWLGMMIRHASITEIRVQANGAVRLVSYGDAGFMAPGKLSLNNIKKGEGPK